MTKCNVGPVVDKPKQPRLSADCNRGRHTNCSVLNCTCMCHKPWPQFYVPAAGPFDDDDDEDE